MDFPLPSGFRLSVAAAGFKNHGRPDLALAFSDTPAVAAGMFTSNLFKAAPVRVGQDILGAGRKVRAVVINTGQANACTGEEGLANCLLTQELVATATGVLPNEILPASTGVIGTQLRMDAWRKAVPLLRDNLGKASLKEFAAAIMTTDAFPKYSGCRIQLAQGAVTLAAAAKGAGMICPNMATMLSVVLCDAAVPPEAWREMFARLARRTFNRVTVDGDTSTNDTLYGLANGASGVSPTNGADWSALEQSLETILANLAYMLVRDGEGATKVVHIRVTGAQNDDQAEQVARTVGHSQLVKTAMYGKDANWGRIVAAVGRSGVPLDPSLVRIGLCGVEVFKNERPTPLDFDALLKEPLEKRDVPVEISLGDGPGEYALLASDLTHEYVNINADYRS